MGQIISGGTVQPDREYGDAILKMPRPTDKSGVMRLLGLFKYLGKYIPNLSARSEALRELTHLKKQWSWTDAHDRELEDLKRTIVSGPVLRTFDGKLPIVIQTDASKGG